MATSLKLPLIAICGRPNVGKSTLFNRITGKSRAIVHAEQGITRDRAYATAQYAGAAFRIVDTGGIVENPIDPVVKKMQQQVRVALEEATVIIFVVDGQQPITRTDEELRDALFKLGKPVVLAVNKLDNPAMEIAKLDFHALGIGEPMAISSGHGLGVDELMAAVVAHLPKVTASGEIESLEATQSGPVKVAVVGKPNVGKSSFVNALLNEERVIVDEAPGTTRDAIDVEFAWKGRPYILIDTAGMRKKAGIKKEVEHYSVARSLRAIRRADVCLVMMDATEGLTEQDKRILDYVQEQGRGMVLLWSKWDLVDDKDARFKALSEEMDFKAPFLRYVPYLTISNVTRQRLFKALEYTDQVAAEARKRISTAELNKLMEWIRTNHPPPTRKGKVPKILYATQASVRPTTFVLFVNQQRLFHFSYLRFIENAIRERYRFEGIPLHIELREGKPQ
jgi:GTP-binding protein